MERPTTEGEAAPTEQPIQFEDEPAADAGPEGGESAADQEVEEELPRMPEPSAGGAPAWMLVPAEMKFPRGRVMMFVRFPSKWTDTPHKGVEIPGEPGKWRMCICWAINTADKKFGYERAQGDQLRVIEEMTKTMIRAVDGVRADWSGMPNAGSIEAWWAEIGERCRGRLTNMYLKMHTLDADEMKYFFESCVAVRTAG